jgi:hypothetical protein
MERRQAYGEDLCCEKGNQHGASSNPLSPRNDMRAPRAKRRRNHTWIYPGDIPSPPFDIPKPKSIGIIVSGGDDYRTKEVKIVRRERKRKQAHRVITCSSDQCTNNFCVNEKREAAADKRTICVEVTWTPKEGIAGGDITKDLTIDPDDLQPGDKVKWSVEYDEKGVPNLARVRSASPQTAAEALQGEPEGKTSEGKSIESPPSDQLAQPKKGKKRKKWKKATEESIVLMMRKSLHDLEKVGIDTCSAVSVSTERVDFPLYLDETIDAKESVILNGVGGANSSIGGRGPMVVRAKDDKGNDLIIFDPAGVYLDCTVPGQQKLKEAGLNLVQDKHGDGTDYLCYRKGELEIPLETTRGILTLKTEEMNLTAEQMKGLNSHIDSINEGDGKPQAFVQIGHSPSKAKLTREEQARLEHWRATHRMIKGGELHENCPVCAEGKRKTASYKWNDLYRGQVTQKCKPYWRMYYDGYGGKNSMGTESYQGAVGGFVFVYPSSGTIKVKLYATTKQFPAILYQVLQEVETEGYVYREMYCDTHKVNFSAAAEEVAAMFKVRLVPVSS